MGKKSIRGSVVVLEFLVIGESKLKIVLTAEDMASYGLESGADYSSAEYRRAFWRVLDLAKAEVGFDPGGEKILIQFYPVRLGGCEVFVTKLGILSKESARAVAGSGRVTMLSKSKNCYAFDTPNDLKRFLSSLCADTPAEYPRADLYRSDSGRLYLIVEEYAKGGESSEFSQVLEFATMLCSELEYFVTEHFEKVASNVEILSLPDFF